MKDLDATYSALRAIMASHLESLEVESDEPGIFYLHTSQRDSKGKPVVFGMVKIGKGRVSYHLMPVYCYPELLAGISQDLKKRMQGKSCFNFSTVDPELFSELGELTTRGLDAYKANGKA